MNSDDFIAALQEIRALVAQHDARHLEQTLNLVQQAQDALLRDLHSRLAIVDQLLLEERAKVRNVLGLHEARLNAVNAYLAGQDVEAAFTAAREVFRNQEGATFDPVLWHVEADWLTALRRQSD